MADLLSTIRAQIDERLRELAPAIAEYERLTSATDALTAEGRAAPGRRAPRPARPQEEPARASAQTSARPKTAARRARRRERAVQSPTDLAILAALEHGSHTVAELVLVTALPAPEIRGSLRNLRKRKTVVKTDRDGRSAYALPAPGA
jgi:hypothetical protein